MQLLGQDIVGIIHKYVTSDKVQLNHDYHRNYYYDSCDFLRFGVNGTVVRWRTYRGYYSDSDYKLQIYRIGCETFDELKPNLIKYKY